MHFSLLHNHTQRKQRCMHVCIWVDIYIIHVPCIILANVISSIYNGNPLSLRKFFITDGICMICGCFMEKRKGIKIRIYTRMIIKIEYKENLKEATSSINLSGMSLRWDDEATTNCTHETKPTAYCSCSHRYDTPFVHPIFEILGGAK